MKLKFWGVRGSIPVCGREYLKYGGDTACVEVRDAAGALTLVDAGTGIRRIGKQLAEQGANGCNLLLTHSHWDHVMGFPFFLPLYRKNFTLRIVGCQPAQEAVRNMVANVMRAPNFPVELESVAAKLEFEPSCGTGRLGGLDIEAVPLSHPNGGNGYVFRENGKMFVFLTDNELNHHHHGGLSLAEYAKICKGADLLVHDADYQPAEYSRREGWGHSTWEMALELAREAGVKRLGLYHHNQDRTDGDVDKIVAACKRKAAESGAKIGIFAAAQDMEIRL
ncbi:MAG: MBL fold metallo-hydrolase [Elusimicrobiales bacterium]|nr:MBL fold metallo-hydrolase [Elusimicrobiales bacterium]